MNFVNLTDIFDLSDHEIIALKMKEERMLFDIMRHHNRKHLRIGDERNFFTEDTADPRSKKIWHRQDAIGYVKVNFYGRDLELQFYPS